MGLSSACSETWPTKTKLRVADEILTFLEDASLENKHIDKASTSSRPKELERNLCKQVLVKRHVRDPLLGSSKFTVRYLAAG